jgi:hypothetical protein
MAEEKDTDTQADPNVVSVSVEEYNKMKAQLQGLQTYQIKLTEKESELERIRQEANELKNKKAPSREEIEQQLRDEFAQKLSTYEEENKQLSTKLKTITVTDKVMNVAGDRLLPDARKFLRMEVEKEADLDETGNIIFKDEQGNTMWSHKRPNEKMNLDEYWEIKASQLPSLFQSSSRSAEPVNGANKYQSSPSSNRSYTWAQLERMSEEEFKSVPIEEKKRLLAGR